jgi:hypothetical protein
MMVFNENWLPAVAGAARCFGPALFGGRKAPRRQYTPRESSTTSRVRSMMRRSNSSDQCSM